MILSLKLITRNSSSSQSFIVLQRVSYSFFIHHAAWHTSIFTNECEKDKYIVVGPILLYSLLTEP